MSFWQNLKKPILALAPMAGITDSAFRQICRENGADVVYSEMAHTTALFYSAPKTLELLKFNEAERPYIVQLFGNNPDHFAKATEIVTKKIKPDGIDINFGCPAKKVFGHGSGCALMKRPELTRKIVEAVLANTDLPVSIKIRLGLKDINALDFLENLKDLPFETIMVHGRTYEGGFSAEPDFSMMEKIKALYPNKIVLANGGIHTPEEAKKILTNYPTLDGLGLARGLWGRPWLFSQIKEILEKNSYTEYDFSEIKKIMFRHAELIYTDKEKNGAFEIRKHLAWYTKGFPGASELRKKLVLTQSLEEIKNIFEENKL